MTIDFDSAIPIPYAPGSLLGYWKNGEPFYVSAGGASDDDEFDSKMDQLMIVWHRRGGGTRMVF